MKIRRIAYTGGANRPPTAAVECEPYLRTLADLAVEFDGSASTDPDTGDTLTYLWDFGDGSPTQTTTTPTTSHTYSTKGTYTATLQRARTTTAPSQTLPRCASTRATRRPPR